jgi:hypothetical protein
MTTLIDTSQSTPYRTLRFATIDELLKELDRIATSDERGTLKCTGNWSAGKILGHLAGWMNFSYEGFPNAAHPPWFIRWLIRKKKDKYVREGMPRGVRIPRMAEGTLCTDEMTTQEGLKRLRGALQRLKNREPVKFHSPAFGEMEYDQRVQMQLRHAELHLGYLQP